MVKGLSRKVIIVKSPDPKIFEQAIFIVKDDYLMSQGIDQKELLRQARYAASGYVDRTYGRRKSRSFKPAFAVLTIAAVICIGAALAYYFL